MARIPNIHSESLDVSSAWELNSFGDPLSVLKLNHLVATPSITKPTHVLVKVYASSVNPIDVGMTSGYGSKLFQMMRDRSKGRYLVGALFSPGEEFPITLGRDFAGIVVGVGSGVKEFKIGQGVYGVVNIVEKGSHADYVLVDHSWIQPKPDFLSYTDATAIPYVALTTWSALRNAGGFLDFKDKKFLVLGGSGGIGTFAVQYLKSKGAHVTTTCSENAVPLLKELGADLVVDYRDPEKEKLLESESPYDGILDCAQNGPDEVAKYGRRGSGKYITLTSPAPTNMKNYGVALGGLKSMTELVGSNIGSKYRHGVAIKWGFFTPDGLGWKEVADLVAEKKIKPVVDRVYKYSELPQAYHRLSEGHLRGKLVIECSPD